jgi:hypothetical protein
MDGRARPTLHTLGKLLVTYGSDGPALDMAAAMSQNGKH